MARPTGYVPPLEPPFSLSIDPPHLLSGSSIHGGVASISFPNSGSIFSIAHFISRRRLKEKLTGE